jgi:hypothetical protein
VYFQDSTQHEYVPRSAIVFWQTIADGGIKFVVDRHPHSCPIHTEGPIAERQYQNNLDRVVRDNQAPPDQKMTATERHALDSEMHRLKIAIDNFELHKKQFEVRFCFVLFCLLGKDERGGGVVANVVVDSAEANRRENQEPRRTRRTCSDYRRFRLSLPNRWCVIELLTNTNTSYDR